MPGRVVRVAWHGKLEVELFDDDGGAEAAEVASRALPGECLPHEPPKDPFRNT